MKNAFQKLAVAMMTAAALAPAGAIAAPALTNLQQMQSSVDATFNNTFAQSVTVSGASAAPIAAGGVTAAAGTGLGNTATYTLSPSIAVPAIGKTVVGGGTIPTLGTVTKVEANVAATAGASKVLQIDPAALAGQSVSVSTTVFGVDNIRATQSVVESTSTTLF